ncbi:hypothetical protein HYC85_030713 [Camellia sinensis]|uniref:Uncharacterized protein n=1 Tax=Camellia sinensis TaxID=4442 RepID=A0A7J7G1K6_CAMSI|nr:hypothetical protein HYC85_030713 [Camellia sinensis]
MVYCNERHTYMHHLIEIDHFFHIILTRKTSRRECSCSETIIRTQFQNSGTIHERNRDPHPPSPPKPRLPLRMHLPTLP